MLLNIKKILSALLPTQCPLCGMASHHVGICHACHAHLPWLTQACKRCGYSLALDTHTCGECLKRSPPYDNTIALFRYEPPVDHLVLSVKFGKNLACARIVGELMSEKIQAYYQHDERPDVILPVPLHLKRLKERGFNQAVEMVRPVARKLGIPLSLHDCVRVVETEPQASVSAEKRIKNVQDAFVLRKNITVNHVAIFDDVVTTGSTVSEVTRLLKRQGVERVDVWCCARTL